MSSKTSGGPRPPSPEGKTNSTPKKQKKKKRGPRTPAPRPPSDDDEQVEVFGNSNSQQEGKTATVEDDPIHTTVFRSAESDEEEDGDNAASIMPAGEIDMAELMMNIRSSAPGSISNHGNTPEVSLSSRPRRGVSIFFDSPYDLLTRMRPHYFTHVFFCFMIYFVGVGVQAG